MTPEIRVKICGLTTTDTVQAAVEVGAAYLGFNFFPPSPRYLPLEAARSLVIHVPPGIAKVALTVDADDSLIGEITSRAPFDMLQLHGNEPPERVTELRERTGLPVMKAVGIAGAGDLPKLDTYAAVADQLLVDAKPPPDGELPGGNGLTFDWRLIANRQWSVPWLLAGGLTAANAAEAIALTGTRQVDVSSGVESAPGVKDAQLIRAFIEAVR